MGQIGQKKKKKTNLYKEKYIVLPGYLEQGVSVLDQTILGSVPTQRLYKTRPTNPSPGADYGSDHELLIAKFRFKLKKVWTTMTRPFMYDLNQIPYDYTVEVTNRF